MRHKLAFLCMSLLSVCALNATTISLKTGNWIFDRYRDVAIDEFDYSYNIKTANYEQGLLELLDGSVWRVVPACEETSSFYAQKYPQESYMPENFLFTAWQEGDSVIFHRLKNRSGYLAYNVTKDRLLDVLPVAAPTAPVLTIAAINSTKDVSYHYRYVSLKKNISPVRYKVVHRNAFIVLSDGSRWEGVPARALRRWIVGDPVHVIKNSTGSRSKTHILMHFKATKKHADAEAKFDRLRAFRAA